MRLLAKLYGFLARRAPSDVNARIHQRILQSNRWRVPLSLRRLSKLMRERADKTAVVIGTVTDDLRYFKMVPLTVAALRFTESARKRIIDAGGECLTLDQLALRDPKGSNCIVLRGPTHSREADKHFGPPPGVPGSHTKPYVRSKGRKFEMARGRRKSRGYSK